MRPHPPILIIPLSRDKPRASGTDEGRGERRHGGRGGGRAAARVRAGAGGAGAQPQERGPRHPPRRAGGVHRCVGSGKSSLAFGALYAEAQRRYLESVAPYARRLFHQMGIPDVDEVDGIPPAVALQQQRGTPTTRSSVGSVTTLSNLLRMLYSRAGDDPPGQSIIYAEAFSPNTLDYGSSISDCSTKSSCPAKP